MARALNRVTSNSGLVNDPNPNDTINPKAVCAAWESAKRNGLLRQLKTYELERILETKRGTRAVILAMLTDAAMDESRDPYWTQPKPSVKDCSEALESITSDIFHLTHPHPAYYTLTHRGINALNTASEVAA